MSGCKKGIWDLKRGRGLCGGVNDVMSGPNRPLAGRGTDAAHAAGENVLPTLAASWPVTWRWAKVRRDHRSSTGPGCSAWHVLSCSANAWSSVKLLLFLTAFAVDHVEQSVLSCHTNTGMCWKIHARLERMYRFYRRLPRVSHETSA